ncbi:biopolymer transport protein ExbD [Methylomagnum ishizawai]|uniref:Biopolymer transport protein ExbD n=1 Tax=Methylomagnum ishizawai TaxID=1760988 RepID=A0A1Y6D3V4_9GAMM|nr:biopolymer transporter ExbD [Methylomagnum ishizawai]SMF95222.1 biopolymer transport protein ExbD [Methylomagnum ishizawai]
MAFQAQSEEQEAMSEINVTPLVDVMLVLMVVFLVTAPLLTQSVKVSLPKTASTDQSDKDQPMKLGIDAQGGVTLNTQPVADLAALETTLKTEVQSNPELAVHLYADQAVNYAQVAKVMAAVQRAGIGKMAFVSTEGQP